jgi:hypothetical protein
VSRGRLRGSAEASFNGLRGKGASPAARSVQGGFEQRVGHSHVVRAGRSADARVDS